MGKRLPQLYYVKMKISFDLGFIAMGVAITVFARNLVHAYNFRIFQKTARLIFFINLPISRSIANKYTLQVSRTLKTEKAFK